MEAKKLKDILNFDKKEELKPVHTKCDSSDNEQLAPVLTEEQMKFIKKRIKRIDKGEVNLIGFDEFKKRYRKYE